MKTGLLSIVHTVVLLVALTLLNISVGWFANHVILNVFEWFNGFNWILKLLILLLGGGMIFLAMTSIYELLVKILGG